MDPRRLRMQRNPSPMVIEQPIQTNQNPTPNQDINPMFSELMIRRDDRRTSEKLRDHNFSDFAENSPRSQDSIETTDNLSRQDSNTSDNQDASSHERSSLQLLSPTTHPSSTSFIQNLPSRIMSYLPPLRNPFSNANRNRVREPQRNLSLEQNPNAHSEGEVESLNLSQTPSTEQTSNSEPTSLENALAIQNPSVENNAERPVDGVAIVRTVHPGPNGSSIILLRILPLNEALGESGQNQQEDGNMINSLFPLLLNFLFEQHDHQRGLDKEVLESLPVVRYDTVSFQHVEPESKKCPICFDQYEDGDEVRYLWCLHRFHKDCVDQWLDSHSNCPICKQNYSEVDKSELV